MSSDKMQQLLNEFNADPNAKDNFGEWLELRNLVNMQQAFNPPAPVFTCDDIKEKKVAIYAEIRFDEKQYIQLEDLMHKISVTGSTDCLTSKDRFFTFDKDRNVWYGNSDNSGKLPYQKVSLFTK